MTAGAPWSVKGIDPKAREMAKDLARRQGMTLGEWLNRMILEEEGPDEVTSEAYFTDRPSQRSYADALRSQPPIQPAPPRIEAPRHMGDEVGRVTAALERLSERIEASEARATEAIGGVELSVRGALERIEATERDRVSIAAHFEGAVEEIRETQEKLAEQLRRVESDQTGSRSAEAVRSLETALGRVASRFYEGESRTEARLAEVEARMDRTDAALAETADHTPSVDDILAQVGARLEDAEARTSGAIEALRSSLAQFDGRLAAAETGEVEVRLESLAAALTRRIEEARAELAQGLSSAADARFERMESKLAEMAGHIAAAETRSARAIESMGREVLSVAEVLNRRVAAAEKGGQQMARLAETMEARINRGDAVHAQALERLSGEIAKISERLAERISGAERRSAAAIDEVSEKVARVTERLSQRHDRASDDIAERIRQSEERTARLLDEARERIDSRLAEAQKKLVEAAPSIPATDPYEPQASPFGPDILAELAAGEPEEPAVVPSQATPTFSQRLTALVSDPFADVGDETPEPFDDPHAVFDAADEFETVSDQPLTPDFETPSRVPPPAAATEPMALSAPFAAEPPLMEPAPQAASGSDGPLSTRDLIEQARAAARAAASRGDSGPRLMAEPKADNPASGLFSALGGVAKKRRSGSTLQTTFLVAGAAASLGVAAAGIVALRGGQGELPERVANGKGAARPHAEIASGEVDPNAPPRAAVALNPKPIEPDAPAAAANANPTELYADAVRRIGANDASGLEALKQAANLGHPPAQFYLGKLYEEGRAGLTKNAQEARRWTERAASGGDRKAMHNLALYYFEGAGGAKDPVRAAQWFRKAAELGLVDSQYNLGRLYEEGLGVSKNPAEALKWYLIAARTGDNDAKGSAARVRAGLSSQAQSIAERSALAFRASTGELAVAQAAPAAADTAALTVAQQALSRLGYYQGPIDGVSSPALRGAVAAYQRDQGIASTGALDTATIGRLSAFTR